MSRLGVVFAGGGCRAFWALGVYEHLRTALPPVDEWAGVSAGSAMALAAALDSSQQVVDEFCTRAEQNPANFHWREAVALRRPFPQEGIYRDTILSVLTPRLHTSLESCAPIRVLSAEVGGPYRTYRALSAWRAYLRRRKQGALHGPESLPVGVYATIKTAQELPDRYAVADAILESSASPPITRAQVGARGTIYDGCLVDNVPVRALQSVDTKEGANDRVLVLLNRPMADMPQRGSRLYLAPSQAVPVKKWDYTNPEAVHRTVAQGYEDAEAYMPLVRDWLSS